MADDDNVGDDVDDVDGDDDGDDRRKRPHDDDGAEKAKKAVFKQCKTVRQRSNIGPKTSPKTIEKRSKTARPRDTCNGSSPQPKSGGSGGSAPQPKLEVKWFFFRFFLKRIRKKSISPLIFGVFNRKSRR